MQHSDDQRRPKKPRSNIGWYLGGALILLAVILAVQGIVRGGGEAAGVEDAAPGGANTSPAPSSTNS